MDTSGHVRVLTMNWPHRRNALSPELLHDLLTAFVDANIDPEVRVMVLTGVGDLAFCAGADLKARKEADDERKPFIPLTANVILVSARGDSGNHQAGDRGDQRSGGRGWV